MKQVDEAAVRYTNADQYVEHDTEYVRTYKAFLAGASCGSSSMKKRSIGIFRDFVAGVMPLPIQEEEAKEWFITVINSGY